MDDNERRKFVVGVLVLVFIIAALIGEAMRDRKLKWVGWGCLTLASASACAVVVLVMMLVAAHAHDHNRPELNGWFKSLQSGKGPCCDGSDALSIDDPDWQNDNGHYRVRLEDEWVEVPDDAVITEPNRAEHALVWPYRRDGKLNQIRCFMPGTMS
jgi:hypothetical protein